MPSLSRLRRTAAVVLGAIHQRLRTGPRRPSWTWTQELVLAVVRDLFQRPASDLRVVRHRMDGLGRREMRAGRVNFASDGLGGCGAMRVWAEGADLTRPILYLHGGGYVFGSPTSHATSLAELALATGRLVWALDYRLAPEHPCPAAITDADAALDALIATAGAPHVAIGGDSAGGGLTFATLAARAARGAPMPAAAFALSPWTDLTLSGESLHTQLDADYLGPAEALAVAADHYRGVLPSDDPRVSPAFTPTEWLARLPRTLLLIGGAEVLRDDGLAMRDRLVAAGVPTETWFEPDEVHVWPAFAPWLPRARPAWAAIGAFLAR
jgi:monoterpene epsilon-lactone hydrolase